jgi:ketosteroid isomerase-like protein
MTEEKYEERIERLEKIMKYHEKALRTFKDIKELQDLHTTYAYLLCTREWEKIVDLFTDDAVAVLHRRGRFKGKEELTKIFKEVVQNNRGKGRDGHVALQPDIQVEGDKAAAHWLMYIMIMDPNGGHENMWTHGRHDVEYVRVKGAWKIKYMLFTSPWPREAWSNPTLEQLAEWEKED